MIITRPRGKRTVTLDIHENLPVEERPRFHLIDVPEKDRVEIMDSIRIRHEDGGVGFGGSGTRVYLTVRAALRGWDRLSYEVEPETEREVREGSEPVKEPVPFELGPDGRPTDETLERIPWEWKQSLQEIILAEAMPAEEDVKK